MIVIKEFCEGMEHDLWRVFYTSIRYGCARHYTPEQVQAWAPEDCRADKWSERIRGIHPYVAVWQSTVVGYADLQQDGYIDHFFVHGQHQSRGVGAALMGKLLKEGEDLDRIYTHASITARPFFQHYDFDVVKTQEVEMRGVKLRNHVMERIRNAD